MAELPVPRSWLFMAIGFILIIMSMAGAFYLSGTQCDVEATRNINLPNGTEVREDTATLTGLDCAFASTENGIVSLTSLAMIFLGGSLVVGGLRDFFRGN